MKSPKAIKGHKTIMHSFSVSPTELFSIKQSVLFSLNELTVGIDLSVGGGKGEGRKASRKAKSQKLKISKTTNEEKPAFIIF